MRTHIIPRADVKGQDRLFIFFSIPGLVGTLIGLGIGYLIYSILALLGAGTAGLIIIAILAGIGFVIGQVKIPDSGAFPIFKKIGGEYIRDIILRYIKFNKNKKKIVNPISASQVFMDTESTLEKVMTNKQ